MRILRMRPNTSEFITQQLQILWTMQAEQEPRERQQQIPHPRSTGCARNTSLTSG
ncbi:hypothetical protein BGY98DRAFT_1030308, partial [Russula aff. rugulosa BPL654]